MTAAFGSGPRVAIRTPSLQGSINLKGAQIDDLLLLNQRQTIAKNSPPVRLLSPLGAPGAYIAQFGWTAQGGQAPALDTVWTADNQVLSPDQPVTLSTPTADGSRYQIKIAVDDGYLFTIQQSVTNASAQPLNVRPIGLVSRAAKSADPSTWTNHVGPIGLFDGKANYDVNWKDLDEGKTETFNNAPRLARLHRQILADRAGAAGRDERRIPPHPSGGYQADYALARDGCAGPDRNHPDAAVRRRQGKGLARPLRERGHPEAFQVDRLGLVRMVHAADLRPADVPVPHRSAISAWRSSA